MLGNGTEDIPKDTVLEVVRAYMADRSSLVAAWVFGSTVKGGGWKREPDVDVAVYLRPDAASPEAGERIREELERELKRKVDVVVLNFAPLLLRYEVFREGVLVHCSDEDLRVDFEVRSLLEFYDLEPLRRRMVQEIFRMAREGKF
ncbi:MAG: hypothetical protein DRP95_02650 [Candidatus Latescibacterota bacterium]|nr:MAG: hypothetical protein DRP95_02650 [Candidatus Latescibacterota bacterium]